MSTGHPYVKNEKFRETCPISLYDVAAVETWLEDLARRGYRPVGFTGARVALLPDEPRESRFRLQPLQRRKETLDPERVEAYWVMGWQLVGQLGPFWVWRCDDPAAPELDTDPVVQGEGYRYLKRRMARSLIWTSLLLAVFVGVCILYWLIGGAPLLNAVEDALPGYWLCAVPLSILGLVQIVLNVRNMRDLWRTLTAGVPLTRPKPYRRAQILGGAAYLLMCLFYVMCFVSMGLTYGSGPHFTWGAEENGTPKQEVRYVDLRALDGAQNVEYFRIRTKCQELAPRMYWVDQTAPWHEGAERRPRAATAYYEMLTEGLAAELTEELLAEQLGFLAWVPGTAEPVPASALDGFWWTETRYEDGDTIQYAVARLGRRVLAVGYTGPTDLRTETAYLASLLME